MENKPISVVCMPKKRAETILYTDYLIIEKNVLEPRTERFVHTHSFYELEIVISGTLKLQINSVLMEVKTADFWMSLPNDIHDIYPTDGGGELLSVKFTDRILSAEMRDCFNTLKKSLFGTLTEADLKKCREMFLGILENYCKIESEFGSEIYAKSALEMMLAYVMNYCVDLPEKMNGKKNGGGRIFDAVDYIKKNYREPITVNHISRHFNYSPNYFSSKFKDVIGCSAIDFINNERLRHAYYLLTTSDMTVSEIAAFVGFDSLSYFSKLFKRRYGMAPSLVQRK